VCTDGCATTIVNSTAAAMIARMMTFQATGPEAGFWSYPPGDLSDSDAKSLRRHHGFTNQCSMMSGASVGPLCVWLTVRQTSTDSEGDAMKAPSP
jgi:hypothetical protein